MTFRNRLASLLDRADVQALITAVIVINAVVLGLETYGPVMQAAGDLILLIDALCLAFFVVEIAARLIVHRWRFFRQGWNVFDFLVVGIALLPAGSGLSVLRSLRVLRVLRVISVAPRLRRVVEGFLSALPGMASVFLLMALIFYVGAVMATRFFGQSHPEWFGDLGSSAYTLFQIMTLESWSMGIVRPVMDQFPWAWAFFVPFIMVTTFAVVNLLVGLIVNSMQTAHEAEGVAATDAWRETVLDRLTEIENRLPPRG